MYQDANDRRVILIAHSQGSLRSTNFLNQQPIWWRNKYIHKLITLAAPWAGAVDMIRQMMEGKMMMMML